MKYIMKKEFCCECWNCKEKVIIFSWDGCLNFNGFYHSYHAPQTLIPSIQRYGDHWANTCECVLSKIMNFIEIL